MLNPQFLQEIRWYATAKISFTKIIFIYKDDIDTETYSTIHNINMDVLTKQKEKEQNSFHRQQFETA